MLALPIRALCCESTCWLTCNDTLVYLLLRLKGNNRGGSECRAMHNSLHIRDLLRNANSDPLCIERRDPHRLIERDPAAQPSPGDVTVDDNWAVAVDWPDTAVAVL